MNVFITGISKGIGLALTTEALNKGHRVFGVARNPESSPELSSLIKSYPDFHLINLDLLDPKAEEKLLMELKECSSLDIVINNAGIYEKGSSREEFLKSFEVNSFTPFLVSHTLLPKLKMSKNPKLIHISSIMGSIEETSSGGAYAYRASKAALNMINKSLTVENKWLTTAVLHPGWVQTRMGGESAPLEIKESSSGLWKVIEGLSPEKSGSFLDYQGAKLPW